MIIVSRPTHQRIVTVIQNGNLVEKLSATAELNAVIKKELSSRLLIDENGRSLNEDDQENYISFEYSFSIEEGGENMILAPSKKEDVLPCLLFCMRHKYRPLISEKVFSQICEELIKSQDKIIDDYDFIDWVTVINNQSIRRQYLYDAVIEGEAVKQSRDFIEMFGGHDFSANIDRIKQYDIDEWELMMGGSDVMPSEIAVVHME